MKNSLPDSAMACGNNCSNYLPQTRKVILKINPTAFPGLVEWQFYRDCTIYLPEVQAHRTDNEFMVEHLDVLFPFLYMICKYLAIIPAGLKIQ